VRLIDWIVVGGYVACLVLIGSLQKKRAEGKVDDYFVSGRKLPWWIAGTSMIAASFASDTPLLVSGLVRSHGIWRNWMWWGTAISLILTVFFFSRLWRRSLVLTEVELTELRYSGRPAAALRGFKAFYWGLLYNCFVAGAWSITGLRKVLQSATGLDPLYAIVVCTAIAGIYSILSGFWGVVATDCFQFVLAIFGAVACAYFAVQAAGGWDAMMANPAVASKLDFVPADPKMFLWFLSFVLVQWWAWKNTDGGGLLVQRMAACKNERHAVYARSRRSGTASSISRSAAGRGSSSRSRRSS
jgi:solute:Na+ symporter, SSS family